MQMSYWRFAAMIATSTVVMLALMYLNTYALEHVTWSETRAWMALLMGATMAIVMLGYMLGMYRNRALNIAIFVGAGIVFALTLWLVRSQATVNDSDYMKAMIPHHSIAILTSTRAQISDPRVRRLANEIAAAQRREIAEMKYLVAQLQQVGGDAAGSGAAPTPPRLVPASEAIRMAQLELLDLAELDLAEVGRVLPPGARCTFHYSSDAGPVLAATPAAGGRGVVKLHGRLVALDARFTGAGPSTDGGVTLSGDGIGVTVEAGSDGAGAGVREADARLQLEAGLSAGYGGYYRCSAPR